MIGTAGGLGLLTITWDVDPRDWSLPGTGAIYIESSPHAQNGSIILMHDGGGPRDETLAALPRSSTPCAPAASASRLFPSCSATR